MRYLYISLIVLGFSWFSYGQFHQFQLVLVNSTIGSEVYAGCYGCGYESNDEGLNAIFENHNVVHYEKRYLYGGTSLENFYGAVHVGTCNNCNIDLLVTDLNEYDSVIRIASSHTDEDNFFNHGLRLELADSMFGIPTGEVNGIITTNNADLNQVFVDYNVVYYDLIAPGGINDEAFELLCECNAESLKQELDTLTEVVSSTGLMTMYGLLSVNEVAHLNLEVYPNPFKNKLKLDVNKPIDQIILYDILGKSVYESSSISHFEDFSSTLKSGVYLLKLLTDEGETLTKKLIKS